MNSKTKKRAELKSYFRRKNIPTEEHFAALIDSGLNYADDGFIKTEGNPLAIEAVGDEVSQKRALSFFNSFSDNTASWSLSLNPRANRDDVTTAKPGFSINDADGQSRFFVQRDKRHVGVGTVEPKAPMHIHDHTDNDEILRLSNTQNDSLVMRSNSLSVQSQANQNSALFLQPDGGQTKMGGDLHIEGKLASESGALVVDSKIEQYQGRVKGFTTISGELSVNGHEKYYDYKDAISFENFSAGTLILTNSGQHNPWGPCSTYQLHWSLPRQHIEAFYQTPGWTGVYSQYISAKFGERSIQIGSNAEMNIWYTFIGVNI